jgi:signal transduction histidine kinase
VADPGDPGDKDGKDDALAFVSGSLGKLGQSLPQLYEKLRAAAAARGETLPPSLQDAAASGGERFAAFAEYLRRFGRPDDAPPSPLPLRALVDEVVALVRPELERRARLVVTHAPAPPVLATERQLAQVLVNLLINAGQAIPAGHAEDHRIEIRVGTDARGRAIVDVEDSGAGIPVELRAKIFEPYFSTKRGLGSGLGLSIAREIILELGGELQLFTEVGKGTRFRVELPPATGRPR